MNFYRKTAQADIDSANDPLLRMITVPRKRFAGDKVKSKFEWLPATPQNVKNFSATAYYFAKNLRAQLDVPVGIVSCNYGGTPAEAWMSRETLDSKPDLKRIVDAYDQHVKTTWGSTTKYVKDFEAHEIALAKFKAWRRNKDSLKKKVRRPELPMGPRDVNRPCGLYETMLSRTIPFTVRGVIWYQGESNASHESGHHYRSVFSTLIDEWRREFKNTEICHFCLYSLRPLRSRKPTCLGRTARLAKMGERKRAQHRDGGHA